MAYATQDDLVPLRLTQKDLIELTDDDDTGAVNADIVTAALTEASGRVESYCRARYVTPLQQSEDLKSLTLDIAIYLLFSRRRETRIGETVQQRYDNAIAFLKDISSGKASLDQPATAAAPQGSLAGPEISNKDQNLRFSDCQIEGFV
ncbi:MAG: gp436 family protein [Chloroflexota bacterium]